MKHTATDNHNFITGVCVWGVGGMTGFGSGFAVCQSGLDRKADEQV